MPSIPTPGDDARAPGTDTGAKPESADAMPAASTAAAGSGDDALVRNPGAPPAPPRAPGPKRPPGSGTIRAAISRARAFAQSPPGVDEVRYRLSMALLVITCLMALAISIAIAVV